MFLKCRILFSTESGPGCCPKSFTLLILLRVWSNAGETCRDVALRELQELNTKFEKHFKHYTNMNYNKYCGTV